MVSKSAFVTPSFKKKNPNTNNWNSSQTRTELSLCFTDAHCWTSVLNSSVYFWINYHLPLIFSSVLWLKKTKERNWRKWKKKQAVSKENIQRTFRESGELLIKTSLKITQKSPAPRKERKWGVAQDFTQHQIHFTLPFLLNIIFLSNAVDTDCLQPVSWLLNVSI